MTHWVRVTGYCDVADEDWDDTCDEPTNAALDEVGNIVVRDLDQISIIPVPEPAMTDRAYTLTPSEAQARRERLIAQHEQILADLRAEFGLSGRLRDGG